MCLFGVSLLREISCVWGRGGTSIGLISLISGLIRPIEVPTEADAAEPPVILLSGVSGEECVSGRSAKKMRKKYLWGHTPVLLSLAAIGRVAVVGKGWGRGTLAPAHCEEGRCGDGVLAGKDPRPSLFPARSSLMSRM